MDRLALFDNDQLGEVLGVHGHGHVEGLLVLHWLGDGAGEDAILQGVLQVRLDGLEQVAALKNGAALHALGEGHGEGQGIDGVLKAAEQGGIQDQGADLLFLHHFLAVHDHRVLDLDGLAVADQGGDGVAEDQVVAACLGAVMPQIHQHHAGVVTAGRSIHRPVIKLYIFHTLGQGEVQILPDLVQGNIH